MISKFASLRVGLFAAVASLSLLGAASAVTIQGDPALSTGTFKLLDSLSFEVTLEGTDPAGEGPFIFIVYLTGTDIYGNPTYLEAARGQTARLFGPIPNPAGTPTPATTFRIGPGSWTIPNDGTLHQTTNPYKWTVALYNTAPSTLADLNSPVLITDSDVRIDVIPDLAINSPGTTYAAGSYRGGDILRFLTSWRSDIIAEDFRQGRPIGLPGDEEDDYIVDLRLSTDPEYSSGATDANDDFKLMRVEFSGDLGGLVATGTTGYRKVVVTGTPGPITAYGISQPSSTAPIPLTDRTYIPQPDDGFLDIGESVDLTWEYLIPRNYMGRYFAAVRAEMVQSTRDADENNTFVSNAANKIEILENVSPTIEPASAISTDTGIYRQGGNAASDFGSVSENGDVITFSSRASNLLVPPNQASSSETTVPPQYATSGSQIFIRYRQTREIFLASRDANNTQANADCFNPAISADGRYIAYDSAATNLLQENTGGRSMIYVFDTSTGRTALISRNALSAPANGSSFNPSISSSGRFVTFESVATDLDTPAFTPNLSGGRVVSYTPMRTGAGYNPAVPPTVTITGGGGSGARARANVGLDGSVLLTVLAVGSGYTSAPTVTIAAPTQFYPPEAGLGQVYLHDRDADGNGIFDEAGNTAMYLVSIAFDPLLGTGAIGNNLSLAPVVNLNDTSDDINANGGMYVAFASYGTNLPDSTGRGMVYRALVDVQSRQGVVDLQPVSINDDGQAPVGFNPYSLEPAINGDGSQVAFTSNGENLVYNNVTQTFDGDTNMVPDIFIRNFNKPLFAPGDGAMARVSISQQRVATGYIIFNRVGPAVNNVPNSNPTPDVGEFIKISDGVNEKTFTFATAGGGDNVVVGANVQQTRDNLIGVINSSGLNIIAEASTPPNDPPGTGYFAAIYLKNTVPGTIGNVPFGLGSPVFSAVNSVGMDGGGSQATDAPVAVQGVPFGSNQPSIDRSGRLVAFRTIAENLDVHIATDSNTYPSTPIITGELIRPLIFPTSNVYLHDRQADGNTSTEFDEPDNYLTTRVSVDKFGYPTLIFGSQPSGVSADTSANSSSPAISANGRFVVFSSDSEGGGGLVYGDNNLSPLDNTKFKDVFVHDRLTTGANPPQPTTKPTVEILSPTDNLFVAPLTQVPVYAGARAATGKTISSAELFVNGASRGILTEQPFNWNYTIPTTGEYVFRVVVTDSKGLTASAAKTVIGENPGFGAPSVFMTQPTRFSYVAGSTVFLNARAVAVSPASIDPASVSFSVNGVRIGGAVMKLGENYGLPYTIATPDSVALLRAEAKDSVGRVAFSAPRFVNVGLIQRPMPEVSMRAIPQAVPVQAGSIVRLEAEALFEPGSEDDDGGVVSFFVNNVYVGTGAASGAVAGGRAIYTYDWEIPEIVSSTTGPAQYVVQAQAEQNNWFFSIPEAEADTSYRGSTVSAATPLSVYYVPTDPQAGSNEQFVLDTFTKVFLRVPAFSEYQLYLDLLNAGYSQAQVVEEMMGSPEYMAFQNVLFGYYFRMGLSPTTFGVPEPSQLLASMTDATGLTLLPTSMTSGVVVAGSPYGATVGQADAAQALINVITKPWTTAGGASTLIRNLSNTDFVNWMWRTFNPPYLPANLAPGQNVLSMGGGGGLTGTMAEYLPQNRRQGAIYAFTTAFYGVANPANQTLKAYLSEAIPKIKGVSAKYLLTGVWDVNAPPISTEAINSYLPPQITSAGTATARVGLASINLYQITATNTNVTTRYSATNLPPGITNVNPTNGIISGTPSTEGNYNTTVFASRVITSTNGTNVTTNTLVGSQALLFSVVAQPPVIISPSTASGTNNEAFSTYQISITPTNADTTFGMTTNLPPGLVFDDSFGTISGTPVITNAFTNTLFFTNSLFATNSGGAATNSLVISIAPSVAPLARYLSTFGLSGANAQLGTDLDGDGHNNGTEFAFGMRADLKDVIPIKSVVSGPSLKLFFTRRTNAGDVEYVIESTPSLSTPVWLPVAVTPQPDSDGTDVPTGYQRVSVTLGPPTSGGGKFYRVRASIQPAALTGP